MTATFREVYGGDLRDDPEDTCETVPASTLPDGFYWRHYPEVYRWMLAGRRERGEIAALPQTSPKEKSRRREKSKREREARKKNRRD